MKLFYKFLITICAAVSITYAQPPANYYNSASGLSGAPLKTALYNIIKNHSSQSYGSLWTHFQTTDKKANGKVWDIYSNNNYTFGSNQCGNYSAEGDCYNREHSWPKSWFSDATPMYSDLFHLYPSDGYVNGRRGNFAFGNVSSPTYTSGNGSKVGPNAYPGYTGTVFEPVNEYKGDLARSYFYMVTRYENLISGWQNNDNDADATLNGTTYPAFENWALNLLYSWHTQDPVSQKEIDRNNAIYGIQNNRNPYIDHPEWVAQVWGFATVTCSGAPATAASALNTSFIANNTATLTWTSGNGLKRIVAVAQGTSISYSPTGSISGVNTNFASAADQGSGVKVVYDGTGSSVAITGLTTLTGYTYKVYEYCTASLQYNTGATTYSFTTTGSTGGGGGTMTGAYLTLLGETFTSCPASGWTTYSVASNRNWQCGTSSGQYMVANAFGGDVASNDWLITPALNLSSATGAAISFRSWTRFADTGIPGSEISVKYSTNYAGTGDPSSATWTTLSGYLLSGENSQGWTVSGWVPLPGNSANTYVAFHYISSGTTTNAAAQWEIDDVWVTANTSTTPGVTTCTAPSMQASNLTVTSANASSLNLLWNNGNGSRRIIVAREAQHVNFVPIEQYFGVNNDFQLAEDEGDGNKVVYDGTSNTVSVTNLSAQTTYYFQIFEYCTSGYSYNTANIVTTSGTTIVPPTTFAGQAVTILGATFTTCPANGWTTFSVASNKDWYCGTASGGLKFMGANGYNGNAASDDWLISPALNLSTSTGNIINFKSWTRYKDLGISGAEISIKYSTDYSGSGNPTSATWSNIAGATFSTENSQVWAASGNVSIPATSANTYIAFQYTSSGTVTDAAAQWQIDDVFVLGTSGTVTTSTSNFITSFNIPSMLGNTILGNNIYIQMPNGTSLASLTPTIGISALAAITPNSGVAQNFSSPFTYTVTSQALTTNIYTVYVSIAPLVTTTSTLFFSEYVEVPVGNAKYLEIFNPTNTTIDLAAQNYATGIYSNGATTMSGTTMLTGSIAAGGTYVIANTGNTVAGVNHQQFGSNFFNGDDVVVLMKNSIIIDAIGKRGEDPGTEWAANGVSTLNQTIKRKPNICTGDANADDNFDPSVEWETVTASTFAGLGAHTSNCVSTTSSSNFIINMSIAGMVGSTISGNNIYVIMPNGTSLASLTPTVAISALATITPNSGVAQNFSSPFTYTVTSQALTTNIYTVYVSVQPALSTANDILYINIPGMAGSTISGNNIEVLMPTGTSVTTLLPLITVSGLATVSPASGIVQNFTTPVSYTVTSQALTTKIYTVSVTVMPTLFTANDILAISIAGMVGSTISGNNIHILMPAGTSVTTLAPLVTVSSLATISPNSGAVQNFTTPVTYTVTSQALTNQIYTIHINVLTAAPAMCTLPAIGSSSFIINKTFSDRIIYSWIAGNGTGRVVVLKENSPVMLTPNGTIIGVNNDFVMANDLGQGHKMVHHSTNGGLNTATVLGLNAGTVYYFGIVEYCAPDLLFNSGTVLTATGTTQSVLTTTSEMYIQADDITVYPNPANEILHITSHKDMYCKMYNAQGIEVIHITLTKYHNEVYVGNLSSGLYSLIFYTSANHIKNINIMINR
ncbi:MAG: endonuclease [Cytophagales bacterium]|nr:endonuclease [Cytophagales bacterium]